jgi:hypothetical protein
MMNLNPFLKKNDEPKTMNPKKKGCRKRDGEGWRKRGVPYAPKVYV